MKDFSQYGNRPDDQWEMLPWIPSLLEWIQDCNWPVAGDILPVLALHQSALVPLIHRVLSPHEKDDIWKYWIITCLVPLFSDESINCILSDIQRIAKSPTQGELREEVHEAAVIFLQNRLSKTGRYHLYRQETDPEKRTFRVWYLIANPRGLPKEFVQKELEFRWKLFANRPKERK